MDVKAAIRQVKPDLKESSLKNYVSQLKILAGKATGSREFKNLKWLDDEKTLMKIVDEMSPHTKRNYLNSIVVIMQTRKGFDKNPAWVKYSEERDSINSHFASENGKHKKTERQEKNWINKEQFQKVLDWYSDFLLRRKVFKTDTSRLDEDEFKKLQEYVILRLLQQHPSRNDFATVKVISPTAYRGLEPAARRQNNYLVTKRDDIHFMLHQWKTKKDPSEVRRISLDKPLQKLLRAYLRKIGNREHLFVDSRGSGLSRNSLTKLLVRVFKRHFPGKNISTTLLRHVFLSEKYGDVLEEMKKDQVNLGHSAEMQKMYIKK